MEGRLKPLVAVCGVHAGLVLSHQNLVVQACHLKVEKKYAFKM